MNISLCDGSARTLKILNMHGFYLPVEQMEKIQETCRGLELISIAGDVDAVSKLLVLYGNQLDWACLEGLTENHLKDVTRVLE